MRYLIPYDFTPITRSALDHAMAISKHEPGTMELLHIISKEEDRTEAEKRFDELLAEFSEEDRSNLVTKVKVGDIYKDISREAEEANAQLLIMGTHGAKGLQKILGSHAIKVITSSGTPFIVTQTKGPAENVETIVLPVDLSKESIQITRFASELAKKFKAKVHLVCAPQTDEFLQKRLKNNIQQVQKYLKKEGVAYEVHTLDGKDAFYQEVIDYGAKYRADLFAIAHHPETLLPQFDKFSQELITNKFEVPVLIVNAREVTGVRPAYSFVGI